MPTPLRVPCKPKGFRLVAGGTDNHLVLVDLRDFDAELTGKVAQEALDRAGITCNRNQIPDDPRPPFRHERAASRAAAETTAGMREPEMAVVAGLLARALRAGTTPTSSSRCAKRYATSERRSTHILKAWEACSDADQAASSSSGQPPLPRTC